MICPVCLRDVPKLIGSQQLCPDCFALANEDIIPDVFGGLLVHEEEPWEEECFECDEGYIPEFSCGCVGEDEAWDWADGEPPDDDEFAEEDFADVKGFPPLFRGRPRF